MVCPVSLLGRIMLALLFISAGVMHVQDFEKEAKELNQHPWFDHELLLAQPQYVQHRAEIVQGILGFALFLQIVGAILTIAGARIGYLMLFVFLIPVSVMKHNFWDIPEQPWHTVHMIMFLKNVSIAGALLALAAGSCGKSGSCPASSGGNATSKKQKRK